LGKDSIISALSKIKGLGVLPIVNYTAPGIPPFITLDEALDLGEVIIREVNDEGGVGLLSIENRSNKNLLILDGEILVGGKQGRIVNS
jgi:hypothetical protein